VKEKTSMGLGELVPWRVRAAPAILNLLFNGEIIAVISLGFLSVWT
jgi:hypothetical protein